MAAAQEERFTHMKHDADFPGHAVAYCVSFKCCGISSPGDSWNIEGLGACPRIEDLLPLFSDRLLDETLIVIFIGGVQEA